MSNVRIISTTKTDPSAVEQADFARKILSLFHKTGFVEKAKDLPPAAFGNIRRLLEDTTAYIADGDIRTFIGVWECKRFFMSDFALLIYTYCARCTASAPLSMHGLPVLVFLSTTEKTESKHRAAIVAIDAICKYMHVYSTPLSDLDLNQYELMEFTAKPYRTLRIVCTLKLRNRTSGLIRSETHELKLSD